MLLALEQVLSDFPKLLAEKDAWKSKIINKRKPHTYRIYRMYGKMRVCCHRFTACHMDDSFVHPHGWPAAFIVLHGRYQMRMGTAPNRKDKPAHYEEMIFSPGDRYSIENPLTFHAITPLEDCYTIMVNNEAWSKDIIHSEVRTTVGKDLDEMTPDDIATSLQLFSKLHEQITTPLTHVNGAGLVGGYAACGGKGIVSDYESHVTCPKCLKIIVDHTFKVKT